MGAEGSFLLTFLENSVADSRKAWASALNGVTDDRLETFRVAIRSKIQTLEALINRIKGSTEAKLEIELELAKAGAFASLKPTQRRE